MEGRPTDRIAGHETPSDGERSPSPMGRRGGWALLDVAAALALLTIVLLGAMAAISSAFQSQRDSSHRLDGQLFLGRVLEEVRATPYAGLLSLDSGSLVEGDWRADIEVALVEPSLMQVEVDLTSVSNPEIADRAVLLIADRE